MLFFLICTLFICTAHAYLEAEGRDAQSPALSHFRTFFFVKKLAAAPAPAQEKHFFPMHPQRRLEAEERLSPFHSIFVLHRRNSQREGFPAERFISRLDGAERLMKNMLLSQMQRAPTFSPAHSAKPPQFDTDRIYRRHRKQSPASYEDKPLDLLDAFSDMDPFLAQGDRELEDANTKKSAKKAKSKLGKRLKRARSSLKKTFKINGFTLILFVAVGVVCGYIGYTFRSRSSEHYSPLAK